MATRDEVIAMANEMAFMASIWIDDDGNEVKDLIKFVELVEKRKCKELAAKIELMPFGDTAASFAQWIRDQA